MTPRRIVDAYIRDYRLGARRQLRFYRNQRNLSDAIQVAGLCQLPGGQRHPHQRRLPGATLREVVERLQRVSNNLAQAQNFTELHRLVEREIGHIRFVGPLTVYDVAHRIGAFLRIAPILVYLHRGTKEGAHALGRGGDTVRPDELPIAFRDLRPAEIEDCLCIYKRELRARVRPVRIRPRRPPPC